MIAMHTPEKRYDENVVESNSEAGPVPAQIPDGVSYENAWIFSLH
jgi:hypothetical protein